MSKEAKCYSEGEEVELETTVGPNKSITDDIRERAMRAVAAGDGHHSAAPFTRIGFVLFNPFAFQKRIGLFAVL